MTDPRVPRSTTRRSTAAAYASLRLRARGLRIREGLTAAAVVLAAVVFAASAMADRPEPPPRGNMLDKAAGITATATDPGETDPEPRSRVVGTGPTTKPSAAAEPLESAPIQALPTPAPATAVLPLAAPVAAPVAVPTPMPTAAPAPPPAIAGGSHGTLYVSPAGSDSNPGTLERPFRTVGHGLAHVRAGQSLYLRGGTYVENVQADLSAGTADAPIVVSAYPGEWPVIQGLVVIQDPRYVTLNGFNVTWNSGAYDEHMFKINGGSDWVLQNSEIWGARSFANLLVTGAPQRWVIRGNVIHDTIGGESDVNRSHNLYANTGLDATAGLIERNLLFNATHGTNLKLAGPGGSDSGAANILVRYNTLYNATQPMLIGDGSRNLTIERNIIGGSARGNLVRLYQLTGGGIVVRDNVGFAGSSWCDDYDSTVGCGTVNGANVFPWDPRFDSLTGGGFHPMDGTAAAYGRYAP